MIFRFLKSIDLYGKLPKGLAEPTSSGAIVSMVTIILMTLMLIYEIIGYVSIETNSDIFVDDTHQQDRFNVNMNIQFPKIPCEFLNIDAYDAMGQAVKDTYKQLKWYRIVGNIIEEAQIDPNNFNFDQAKIEIESKNGCEIRGFISVNKVPGKIAFGPHKSHFQANNIQRGLVLDMSHKFINLSFGEGKDLIAVSRQFSNGQLNSLNDQSRIKNEAYQGVPIQHEHFVSIVPTDYTLLNNKKYSVFQYTANHNEIRAQYYPQMIIRLKYYNLNLKRYEISPVTFKYWQTKEDILHFLVQICAILGGIFTVSRMVESGIYKLMVLTKKEI